MIGSSNHFALFCFFFCLFSFIVVSSVPPASARPPTFYTAPTFSTLPIMPAPAVEVERLEKLDKRADVDGFTAAFRGRKLCVAIRHVRGIGRAKLVLKHLPPTLTGSSVSSASSSCVPVEVRFLNFAMLEGFTVGSGGSEIYSLPTSLAKQRKFLLRVPVSSGAAIIDIAWVDAYRH